MNKQQKCALKLAVKDVVIDFGRLIGAIVLFLVGVIVVGTVVTYVMEYLVALYPVLHEPIVIPDEYMMYAAIAGVILFATAIFYSAVRHRYERYIRSKKCEEQK